jgi:hypothetical protein
MQVDLAFATFARLEELAGRGRYPRAGRRNDADAHEGPPALHRALDVAQRHLEGVDQEVGARQHLGAHGRELQPVGGTREQFGAQQFFHLLDGVAQRRLRDGQPLGRAAELAFFDQHGEKLQLAQRERTQGQGGHGHSWLHQSLIQ